MCGKSIKRPSRFRKYCSTKCRNRRNYVKASIKNPRRHDKYNEKKRMEIEAERRKAGLPMIQCKICGKWFRQVGSHIAQVHKMTAREYRESFGLDVKRGILPDDLRKLYGEQALENGTVENLKAGRKYWFEKGQEGVGVYKRSDQTLERLREQGKVLSQEYGFKRK